VRYYKNGTLIHRSTATSLAPLMVDTALLSSGATVKNAMISAQTAK
jgi:hypothetical protein